VIDFCTEIVSGKALHERVIVEQVLRATRTVWLATANLKDMHVARARKGFEPILSSFERMAGVGVQFRLVHSDLPSGPFRKTLEACPRLSGGALELQHCPRSHWKLAIVDSQFAYLGSANFTGAGLGVKSEKRRNLELGVVTTDPQWVRHLEALFDDFWIGEYCADCAFHSRCPDPIRP
jgi:hypothetical protein